MKTKKRSQILSRRFVLIGGTGSVAALASICLTPTAAQPLNTKGSSSKLQSLLDRTSIMDIQQFIDQSDIINMLNRFVLSIDTRDYKAMRDCLTDEIDFDYSALFGTSMPPTADELVENVRTNHRGLRGLQHMTTNPFVTIDGDTATCVANFQAQHFLPNDRGSNFWMLGGRYTYKLARTQTGWKICGCVISVAWTNGNLQLFELAHQQYDATENLRQP